MTLAKCPVCDGTKHVPIPEDQKKWYPGKIHHPCHNCGGQTMSGFATGETTIDPATGLGCVHSFRGENAGRCYTRYTCTKCQLVYHIDSGD